MRILCCLLAVKYYLMRSVAQECISLERMKIGPIRRLFCFRKPLSMSDGAISEDIILEVAAVGANKWAIPQATSETSSR